LPPERYLNKEVPMKKLGLLNRVVISGGAVALGLFAILASTSPATTAAGVSSHNAVRPAATALRGDAASGQSLAVSIKPAITGAACSSSTAHWVTLYIYWDGGTWEYWCFGDKGSFTEPDNNQFTWACSGNNEGTIGYQLPNGDNEKITFGPAWSKSFPQGTGLRSLSLTGWKGSYDC
jgi:hypothetical protein